MAEEILNYKHIEENGDSIEMKILNIPVSEQQPEGVAYSLAYIRNGKRLVGYDNFEGHGKKLRHHRHVKDHITPYEFVDEWTLIKDFMDDIEKIKRGTIK